MKLYNQRFLKGRVSRQIYEAKAGRDAIVRSIDTTNRYAIVRIQGTDEDIHAYWPENWHQKPPWLRVGNAVFIRHPKGNPTRLEIVGDAYTIPTPVGAGSVLPTQAATGDVVITGGNVLVYEGMTVHISHGTFRIGGIMYTFPGIMMGNTAFNYMGDHPSILMGMYGGLVKVNAAPSSPNFRVDLLAIGADRVVDYIAGTPHASNPQVPALPANHTAIATIIVPYGTTELQQSFIGTWSAPYMTNFTYTCDTELLWAESQSVGTILITDQYGKPFSGNHRVTVVIESGNGKLTKDSSESTTSLTWNFSGSSTTFIYQRGGIDGLTPPYTPLDSSPMIKAYLTTNTNFYSYNYIMLYDSSGDFMP